MEPIWFKNYGDIPREIDADAYANVWEMMSPAIEKYAARPAFHNFGASLTYGDIDQKSRDLAAYMQSVLGLKKGDRVAVMAPNIMAFPISLCANIRAGLVQVNVNPLYTPRELEHQLNDADTDTIIIFSGSTPVLAEIIANTSIKNVIVANLGDCGNDQLPSPPCDERLGDAVSFIDALAAGANADFSAPQIQGDDLIFLQYTGGTTGLSKGAMLTHRNLVSNIMAFRVFAGDQLIEGEELVITALPLYHIFALMVNTLTFFVLGGESVLITNPRDMPGFVKELANWKFTMITGVNTLFNGLLHTPGFEELDFSELRFTMGGGTAILEAVSNKWRGVVGHHITEGYGLSETAPVVTVNPLGVDQFRSSIGFPFSSTEISLRDDEGKEVALGEPGELCVRGPQVMQGYWRKPEETAAVMTDDGFFCTGDIATCDEDGYFRIVDRKKDMILVSGFNVYPNEIEAVATAMDGIVECACIGVPDDSSGEAVKLFVVAGEGVAIEDISDYCRANLTGYKVPKQIVFIDEIPKSPVGKILRRELRD
jgi:long-chain acyl-CoA synthetase